MADEVHRVRRPCEVLPLARCLALGCDRPSMVAAGLAELISNGIEHGNLEIGFARKRAWLARGQFERERQLRLDAPSTRVRDVCVSVDRFADVVRFRIRDQGSGFDWPSWLDFDESRADAPNGRGIALARASCFASLYYIGRGNVVEALALRA
ncbi:MAG: ATP-binding protein [Rhodocyclaceae bacterium]|nr:ATP-binding protein [Rhodocyclaceae bacterium]